VKRFIIITLLFCLVVFGICFTCELVAQPITGQTLTITSQTQSPVIDSGDTAWMLISIALVMLMTPGLAFFYGGMVRRKNILGILMQCFIVLGVITAQWIFFGYSLAFAPGKGFWGGFAWFGLNGVGSLPFKEYAATIPHEALLLSPRPLSLVLLPKG
jgi:hypothetical protein